MKIYRGNSVLADVELDDKSVYKYTLMGDDLIDLNFTLSRAVLFDVGDYIVYNNQNFKIVLTTIRFAFVYSIVDCAYISKW
jgi:hypothetical protein